MRDNATTHNRFKGREAEPLSLRTILALVLAIIGGVALCWYFWQRAQFPNIQRYTFGDRPPQPPRIGAALLADLGVIAGYVLVLGACAFITSRLAVSQLGVLFGRSTRWALFVAATADLLKDLGLYFGTLLHSDPNTGFNGFLTVATAAMATITTCSLVVALMAVPGTFVVVLLRAFGRWQLRPNRQGPRWWNDCWAEPEVPTVGPDAVEQDEWSWVNAYNVPGAAAVIERRKGEPVQAICLSGGGVRSACLAMGALQVFSDSAPACVADRSSEDDHAPGEETPAPQDGHARPDDVTAAQAEPHGQPKLIDSVDYVISVSGGGYTAGARLLACQRPPNEQVLSGNEPAGTPTSMRDPVRKLRLSERFEEGSVEFEHVRQHSSYIADSAPDLIRALSEVLKNLVASVVTLFWMPVAIGFAGGYLLAAFPIAAFVPVPRYSSDGQERISEDAIRNTSNYLPSLVNHPAAWLAAGVFVAIAVIALGCALFTEWLDYSWKSEHRRLSLLTGAQASSAFAGLIVALTVALPALMWACQHVNITHYSHFGGAVGGLLGLQYLTALVAMLWKYRNRIPVGQISGGSWRDKLPAGLVPAILVTLTLTAVLIAWLGVLGSVAAGVFGYLTQHIGGHLQQVAWLPVWVIVLVAMIFMLSAADVTSLSLHPFYRARLARTFAVRRFVTDGCVNGAAVCEARPYPAEEPTWLHAYGKVEDGPQFVLAAAAAVSGDAKPAPGLNAVSYVLNEKYVGGPALGWLKTEQLWRTCPPRLKRDLTVEAAVAISGAAFASTMGRQNNGFQTLLCLSGARLGTWLPNPNYVDLLRNTTIEHDRVVSSHDLEPGPAAQPGARPHLLLRSLPTVRGFTYFYRELLGRHPIDASLVQVTDGGHYENLGLVEALRRRCRVIFCIDGSGDPPPLLCGLADAIRLARSELGVEIELEDSGDYGVQNLATGSGRPFSDSNAFAQLNSRITSGTVVRGRITYPPASGLPNEQRTGTLIFAKAVLWQGCPDWLLTYGAENEVFPHDSTSDQWFEEGQFAAYTELGRLLGRNAVEAQKAPLQTDVTEHGSGDPAAPTVPDDNLPGSHVD